MIQYALYLENPKGQRGWFMMVGGDGIITTPEVALAARCESEADAETLLSELVLNFGLNRDEAKIEQLAVDSHAKLELGDGEWPDTVEVSIQEAAHTTATLLVRESGEETTTDIPSEVGEILIRLIAKLKTKIS